MAYQKASVAYDFDAQTNDELTVRVGETVDILDENVGDGWWMARNGGGREGLVPSAYLELQSLPEPAFPPPPPPPSVAPIGHSSLNPLLSHIYSQQNEFATDEYDVIPNCTLTKNNVPKLNTAPSIDWEDEEWDDSDDNEQKNDNRTNGVTQKVVGESGRSPASRTVSTTSAGGGSLEPRDTKAPRTVRGFPKIPGVKDFLCNCSPKRISERDVINIVETEYGCIWENVKTPFTCAIAQPKKETKMKGLKSFIAYQITPSFSGIQVSRRFKHFDWLYKQLLEKFPCICVPPLPDKQITGCYSSGNRGRYEDEFIQSRMRQLQLWINRTVRHPVLGQSQVLNHFVSCTDEKRWKDGKRRAEKDDLRGGHFFLCIRPPMRPVEWIRVEQNTEGLENFVNEMDNAVKLMQDSLVNNSKKQQNQIRKEYVRLGDGFKSLAQAFEQDPNTASQSSNASLKNAVNRTSATYNEIGALFERQHERDIDPLLERLQEYQGILSCFPQLIQMQRGAIQTVRECQRNKDDARMNNEEFNNTVQRAAVISCAETAETNYFQQERVADFKDMMRDYLAAQITFYREITHRLEEALSLYNTVS